MADAKNQEKGNFFQKTGQRISKWFREMRSELKKVVWPSRKQLIQNSLVVLLCVLVVGVFIWVFDAVANLVVQGLGISLISSRAAENYGRENRLLVFSFPEISGRRLFYTAVKRTATLPECAKDFLRYIRQYYAG